MKTRYLLIFVLCSCMFAAAACGGAKNSSESKVNAATSVAAIQARIPTNTPLPPTPTISPYDVIKDLSGVELVLEDFPDGFKRMSSADMEKMSMTPEQIATGLTNGLSKARANNPTGYMRQEGKQIDVVLSMVVYPLTMLEESSFDVDLTEPEKIMNQFVSSLGSEGAILDGSQEIGDKSIGFGFKVTPKKSTDMPSRGQFMFSRRGNAVTMIFIMYFNSDDPAIQVTDLARKLDVRLAEALAK
jgi:hypothetical protein